MAQHTNSPEGEEQLQSRQEPDAPEQERQPPSQQEETTSDTPVEKARTFNIQADADLPTFFSVVAAGLTRNVTLPGRKAKARSEEGEEADKPKMTFLPLLVTAMAILIGIGVMAAIPKNSDPLPISVMGTWQTASEEYADRGFEITAGHITFQQGEANKFTRHPITGLRATPNAGGSTLYVVEYDNGGDTYEFAFLYQQEAEIIRFKNQPLIAWYRNQG